MTAPPLESAYTTTLQGSGSDTVIVFQSDQNPTTTQYAFASPGSPYTSTFHGSSTDTILVGVDPNKDANMQTTSYQALTSGQVYYTTTIRGASVDTVVIGSSPSVAPGTVTVTTIAPSKQSASTYTVANTFASNRPYMKYNVSSTSTYYDLIAFRETSGPTKGATTSTTPSTAFTPPTHTPFTYAPPTTSVSQTSTNPISLPWVSCGTLNHKGNTFYLRTHVIFGQPKFENLYFQATRAGKSLSLCYATTLC